MKLARYVGEGRIEIRDEAPPVCPPGGLLVRTLASGLCSGELMPWYMDGKIPHVLGHEVCGVVADSQCDKFPKGCVIFPHHHAPCLACDRCEKGLYVHCDQWKRAKLVPGGMAEFFAVAAENLTDTHRVDGLRPVDGALIEPAACVMKSLRLAGWAGQSAAVIGLGSMGLMHMLALGPGAAGYDLAPRRREWAARLGLIAKEPQGAEKADVVFVCPGSPEAANLAISMANPGGTVLLFAPMPPGEPAPIDLNTAYFKDLRLISSYSCGPDDVAAAIGWISAGGLKAEQVVSDFSGIDELPRLYAAMAKGDILKAMVLFD